MIEWKSLVLLNGENGLKLSDLKKINNNYIDFKKLFLLFSIIKKKAFSFKNNGQVCLEKFNFACRWEISREEFLGNSVFNNPPLGEICSQVFRKIFSFGKTGAFQHIIGSEIGLRTCDIHHHINYLIKVQLVVKKHIIIKSRSKMKNAIQLKCKIFETSFLKNISHPNNSGYKEADLVETVVKILSRIDRPIKQKDLKYGVLFYKSFLATERKRIHRIWQKTKKKFLKTNIDLSRITEKNILDQDLDLFKEKLEKQAITSKVNTFDLVNKHNNCHPEILFLTPPEIYIKKNIEYNSLLGISSPYLLEKCRGYLSYKDIQAKLKSLELKKYLSRILEQKGRQRIIRYKKNSGIEICHDENRKIGVTDQVISRKNLLLSWVESKILLVRDLGKKIALKEKKGLRKVDSKVIKKVLRDLIKKGFLKILKIKINIFNQRSSEIEIITKREFDTTNLDFISHLDKLWKNSNKNKSDNITKEFIKKKVNFFKPISNILTFLEKYNSVFFMKNFHVESSFCSSFLYRIIRKMALKSQKILLLFCNFYYKKPLIFNIEKYDPQMNNLYYPNFNIRLRTQNENIRKYGGGKQKLRKHFTDFDNCFIFGKNTFRFPKIKFHLYSKFKGCFSSFFKDSNYKLELDSIVILKRNKSNLIHNFNFYLSIKFKKIYTFHYNIYKEKIITQSNIHFEKWDSELDVNLLGHHFLKKYRSEYRKSGCKLKKNFSRRLNGVLRVQNIKLAISYFSKFFNFRHSKFLSEHTFKPKNFFKRAIEIINLNFTFFLENSMILRRNKKVNSLRNFKKNIKQNTKLYQNFFSPQLSNTNLSSRLKIFPKEQILKFKWTIFTGFSLNNIPNLYNREKILDCENTNLKKKKIKKKDLRAFLVFKLFHKINFFRFCSAMDRDLLYSIPFFLNRIKYKYDNSKLHSRIFLKKSASSLDNSEKISIPLEIRCRYFQSLYKNLPKIKMKVKLSSRNWYKKKINREKISYFNKISNIKKGNIKFRLTNYFSVVYYHTLSNQSFKKHRLKPNLTLGNYFLPWISLSIKLWENKDKLFNFIFCLNHFAHFKKNQKLVSNFNYKIFYNPSNMTKFLDFIDLSRITDLKYCQYLSNSTKIDVLNATRKVYS